MNILKKISSIILLVMMATSCSAKVSINDLSYALTKDGITAVYNDKLYTGEASSNDDIVILNFEHGLLTRERIYFSNGMLALDLGKDSNGEKYAKFFNENGETLYMSAFVEKYGDYIHDNVAGYNKIFCIHCYHEMLDWEYDLESDLNEYKSSNVFSSDGFLLASFDLRVPLDETPYYTTELYRLLKAIKPKPENYFSWDRQNFITDSIRWLNDPLYGWIEKNPKPDGSKWDLYKDGLRIHSTIDFHMQQHAEEAVAEHMQNLQDRFCNEKRGQSRAPYTSNEAELSQAAYERLVRQSIRQSDRYRLMYNAGLTDTQIDDVFNTPVRMKLFSYKGIVDTIMSPRDSILYNKSILRAGLVSMDPLTGHIKAYVGGPDYDFFPYDMVSRGRHTIRSTVQPFVYSVAMGEGMSPCTQMLNSQPLLSDNNGRTWEPRNSSSARVGDLVDLNWALSNSNNWISARLIAEVEPRKVAELMGKMGITTKIEPSYPLCLGPVDVSLFEMVGAYATFANEGHHPTPILVERITDSEGNIISEFTPKHDKVISDLANYKMLSMLLNVVEGGTSSRLRRAPFNLTAQIGGMTGTANNNSDGWFLGFTPELVTGVWVGGDDRYIHFDSKASGQSSAMALPIFGIYMNKVFGDDYLPYSQSTSFEFPENINLCE